MNQPTLLSVRWLQAPDFIATSVTPAAGSAPPAMHHQLYAHILLVPAAALHAALPHDVLCHMTLLCRPLQHPSEAAAGRSAHCALGPLLWHNIQLTGALRHH
jgi:hypothetical protein